MFHKQKLCLDWPYHTSVYRTNAKWMHHLKTYWNALLLGDAAKIFNKIPTRSSRIRPFSTRHTK